MAKQLNVNLSFTADASKARQQLQDLQQSLDKLISSAHGKTTELGLTKELAQATSEASKLKIMLESAMTSTGTLDLGKFSQGLRKSGLELKDYANTLQSLGPEGAKTFAKLAQSITTANVPLKQTNRLLDEFATTMKNTVRWQFSSSMLHGFMGAMSGALGYAKDLDKSLNDIRIVTGYNVDQMAQFATEANKAAKALSSTTTDYTNASLIYYQQGLGEKEIAERTEVTLKMANAAGVSAQKVSDQMTAVWNNFDDGSKSLEYYADVMTALGAATASSTDEISEGLNKFAAVAETVGLSYEYATAALATVTATTRESADVVGTAFKTLFARIQGLNLGETLDDGTTLNKYSSALAKVGIDIKDTSGNMKDMNVILDEMGAKWGTLAKDQQIALAQTVAGVRQYTQLMALMDNWDYFEENVKVAEQSTGTLKEQAEIYAESWEASSKRVKAAAEGIYDKLLDEQFFIGINKILEGTLSHVGNLIDGLGGLPGVLSIISSLMLKAFGKDIATSLERFAYNIKLTSKIGQEEILAIRKKANKELREMYSDSPSLSDAAKADMVQRQADLQDALIDKAFELEKQNKTLTEEEQKRAQLLLEQNNALSDQYSKISELKDAEEAKVEKLVSSIERLSKAKTVDLTDSKGNTKTVNVSQELKEIKELNSQYNMGMSLLSKYKKSSQAAFDSKDVDKQKTALKQLQDHLKLVKEKATETGNSVDHLDEAFKEIENVRWDEVRKSFVNTKDEIVDITTILDGMRSKLDDVGDKAYNRFEALGAALQDAGADMKQLEPELEKIWKSFEHTGELTEQQIQIFANYGIQVDKAGNIIKNFSGKVYTTADSLVAVANIMTNFASVVNSIKGLSDVWSDEDLSYGEKVLSTFTSLGMVLSTLVTTYSNFNKVKLLGFKNDIASLAIKQGLISAEAAENGAQAVENGLLTTQIALKAILNALDLKKIAIYAALALAVGAVVAIGKVLYDQYHADAQGAKEAAEQAEVLTERYEELKTKAQELNDAIADYQDARNALADLEKGTDEYAAALENANEKARELIETYGLWDSYDFKNGIITIDPKALEDAQKAADDAANQARTQMYQGEIYSNQASIRSETTNLQRQGKTFYTGTSTTYSAGEYGSYSASEYRKLTSTEVQAVAQVAADLKESLGGVTPTASQLIAKLDELGVNSGLGSDAMGNLSSIITNESIAGFLSLGKSMSEAEKANRYYAEQILGMAIEDEYGDKITAMATDEESNVDENKYNQILTAFTNRAAAAEEQKGNDITARYGKVENEVRGIVNTGDLNSFLEKYENDTDSNKLINDVVGGNYDGKINNDEELGLLYAQMISGIDKSELTYKAGNGVGTIKDKEGNEIVSGVSDEVMRREIAKQVAMQQITNDYASSVDGNATSLDQLENALNTLITGASKVEKDFGVDFSSAILDAIANENFDSLDFSNLFSELDPEEMARLSGLDSQGILDLLGLDATTLQALGYDVNTFTSAFSDALDNWTYTLDTTDIEEKAAGLKDIADNIKVGDIIDQEAIDKLQTAGVNTSRYFTQMEDGTYKLTGAAKEFQNVIENITVQDYINQIKEFEAANEYAKNQVSEQYGFRNADIITDTSQVGSSQTLGAARADYIKTFDGDFGFTEEQQALLTKDSSQYTPEDLQELANMMDIVINKSSELAGQMLSTADSLDELNNRVQLAQMAGVEISYEEYSKNLIGLASAYDNCSEEIERYQVALMNANEEEVYAAECQLKSSIRIGEAAEKYDLSAESLEIQARELMIANEWGAEYAETAAMMAISNQRMNKGMEKLAKGWKDWSKTLKSTEKTSQDYADTLVELSAAVTDLVGWYDDLSLSSKFVEKNMNLIEKASTGDVNAIMQLGAAVASYEVEQAQLNETIASGLMADGSKNAFDVYRESIEGATTAADAFVQLQGDVQAGFDNIANNIAALSNGSMSLADIFGGQAGLEEWVNHLNAYAAATGMTAQQMQQMLSSVGVTANVQTDYQEQDMTVPSYREEVTNVHYKTMPYTFASGDGMIYTGSTVVPEYTKATVPAEPLQTKGYVEVASISMDGVGETPSVPAPTFTGRQAPSKSAVSAGKPSGGGGSSSKPKEPTKAKKIDTTHKSDVVERYKEVNDALDNIADSISKVQMEADILWGKNHINNLREQNKLLDEQIELLDRQYEEAKKYQKEDRSDLEEAASALSVSLVFDSETGDITNIEDAEESIYRQLAAAEEHYNSLATGEEQDAYEETILEPLRQKIEDFETARDLYYDSIETAEDVLIAKQEAELQKMANNFEIWSEGLEIEIKFNEDDLELIEAMLSRIEDDIYQMAEAAVLMTGIGGSENGQLGEYLNNLDIYDQKLNELNQKYESGEITEAAYYEGLEEIKSGILDNVASIQELDKTMMTYYGDTLVAAGEELARYTDLIEKQNSVLEYYLELLDLMGESADYKKIGVVLEGQAEIAEQQAKTSREWYEARKVDAENAKAAYEEALAMGVSEEEVALLKEKWLAAEEAAAEAQDKMLSDAEAWAEALRAILENKLSELGQTLENALTQGFGSFDAMTTALERANSLQEEYLTTTNQIYETNKLMRTAQQEIDKTSNTVAKRRLKSFIEETQHLQDQTKLSQYELEIQQAKYDLLLAEMALEDAQNAKSTVRLQRDAEGNFGYVYTADQNALAQAEQKLEDAQNRLYNIGLEGTNEYAEKYQQTLNEMYDTLNDIQQQYLEGSFETEEEYHKAMADAKAYYYEKLQQYSSLYQVAITTDSRVVRDAWTSDFSSMIYETDKWMDEVTTYVSAVQEAFTAWKNEISGPGGVEELVGNSLGEISKNVDEVTDKSGNLSDTINDEVIPALNEEINAVDELTNQYATMRESIQLVTEKHLEQVRSINKATEAYYALERAQNAANNASKDTVVPEQPTIPSNSSNDSTSSNNNNNNSTSSNSSNSSSGDFSSGSYNSGNQNLKNNTPKKTAAVTLYASPGGGSMGTFTVTQGEFSIQDKGYDKKRFYSYYIDQKNGPDGYISNNDRDKIKGFDTGGYTGSWGPYGKLAMLHEKELVLNKEDTENFLASMEILDEILKMIDLQSLNSQIGGLLNSPRLQEIQSQMLEQSVKIEAIFPGVSDRNELEEAFNNLINQASQYANRK